MGRPYFFQPSGSWSSWVDLGFHYASGPLPSQSLAKKKQALAVLLSPDPHSTRQFLWKHIPLKFCRTLSCAKGACGPLILLAPPSPIA